ncbi:PP2C family protein-serine/threonine phosphatase [Streptomyces genisteinicus]|uniref:Serine/threonine-protein phosphatase n=1 Tax=Streptomyces genisteinicus TaxID=2768068 RepID=A0A7H0HMG1_9ACTN|nr:PP2C family protein-serine/threonine phosphatase [Streptomyces genisteinicus]QNP61727.1 serine/threonine-protein phosphatase [Streptomyces genisteinicus]
MTEPTGRRRPLESLAEVRRAVRGIASRHGLPVRTRARLTASVAEVARRDLDRGRPVGLTARRGAGGGPAAGILTVALSTAPPADPGALALLPAPAAAGARRTEWRIALPAPRAAGDTTAAGDGAEDAAEEELALLLADMDALTADHERLKHELDETNSGVLALYVQLEERDEQLRRAHGQMLRELEDALRPPPLSVPGLDLAVHYAPADTDAPTGGDLYDWFVLPDGSVHITVVDALGHGVGSTRAALDVTHAVRTLALDGYPLKTIVGRASEVLHGLDPDLMATVLLARIDPAGGELLLANGSHPPALLVRADGGTEYLDVHGRGVGYPLPGSDHVLRARFDPGDLLVLYTDGLTESRRDPLEGERRLAASAARHADRPVEEIPGAIAADMHTLVLHPDDTLALTLRRRRR